MLNRFIEALKARFFGSDRKKKRTRGKDGTTSDTSGGTPIALASETRGGGSSGNGNIGHG